MRLSWLTPPTFADPEQQRIARLLHAVLLTILSVGAAVLLMGLISGSRGIMVFASLTLSVGGGLFALNRTRHTRLTSALLLVGLLLLVTAILVRGNGLYDNGLVLYPVVLLIASLVVGRVGYTLTVAGAVGSLALVTYAAYVGWANRALAFNPTWTDFWLTAILVVGSALFINLSAENLLENLQRAQRNEVALAAKLEELRVSEARFSQLFHANPIGMALDSRTHGILDVNPAFLELTGLDRAQVVGRLSPELPVWADFAERDRLMAHWAAFTELTDVEFVFQRQGVLRQGALTARLVQVAAETVTLISVRDITAQKQAEAEVRQLNTELEARVAVRTADLLRAKEAADGANRAKSDFLSSMSHELRTPLNGILGYAQILQGRASDAAEVRRGLKIIHDSGSHLLGLISDLLDFSKIEAQRFELLPGPVHLASFLEGVTSLMRLRAAEKQLTFVFEPAPDLPPAVVADEKRLRQVLLNLLGNAVKFTERGYVALRVWVRPMPHPNMVGLCFEVEDSGPGLTPTQMARLFKPFEQVGEAQQRAQGTGLGLAISQKLAQAMGGMITLTSTLGTGSTFTFEVPMPLSVAPVTQSPALRLPQGYVGPRKKVLVADDRVYNRLVLLNLLQPLGFEVLEAEDGAQALNRARQAPPDVIFMDLVMPVLTGVEVVQLLRADAATAKILIIGASASAFDEDKRRVMQAGCDGFIAKPIDQMELYATLERLLQVEWVYDPMAPETPSPLEPASPMVYPPAAVLAELRDLTMQGDLFGVEKRAQALAAAEGVYAPFVAQVVALAKGFEDAKLLALLQAG